MIPVSILIIGNRGTGKTSLAAELICGIFPEPQVKVLTAQSLILTPFIKLKKDTLYLVEELMDDRQLEDLITLLTITHVKAIITSNCVQLTDAAKYRSKKLSIIQL